MRWCALLVALCCTASTVATATAQPSAARTGRVTVEVVGLHSSRGRVLAALFCSAQGFPSKVERACARKLLKIVDKRVALLFETVPAGEFALTLFHDENSNATLDTNWIGMPKEGWAMSRDAPANMGPPSYADARLTLAAGEHKRIVVHVRY